MKEWIIGSLFLAAVLVVGYRHGLAVAGSIYREVRRRLARRREVRRLTRVFALPRSLFE